VLRVLRQRDFSLLWFAGLISITGDWMLIIALPITVYELTGSPLATGGILIANKLSALLLGSVAGVLVDRWDRKRTMVIANLIRAPLLLLLLAVNSADRVWIAYVTGAALSAVGQFFRPAENALLPRLVEQLNKKRPSEYFKDQLLVDSMVFSPEDIRHLVAKSGPTQVVYGTDIPIYNWPDAVDNILKADIPDAQKEMILGGNLVKLLKL
jgi:hypothetical protein